MIHQSVGLSADFFFSPQRARNLWFSFSFLFHPFCLGPFSQFLSNPFHFLFHCFPPQPTLPLYFLSHIPPSFLFPLDSSYGGSKTMKYPLFVVIVGTSGSSLFDAGVGVTHPASRGQFWPPEKKRKWPEVGIQIFYHFFSKTIFHFILLIKDVS